VYLAFSTFEMLLLFKNGRRRTQAIRRPTPTSPSAQRALTLISQQGKNPGYGHTDEIFKGRMTFCKFNIDAVAKYWVPPHEVEMRR
jgi:hypothetical protein